MASHNEHALTREILAQSEATSWPNAKLEWRLERIYKGDQPGHCICGHPITKHCVLRNKLNGNHAVVGSCCVKKFMPIEVDKLFAALDKIEKFPDRALPPKAIDYAWDRGW